MDSSDSTVFLSLALAAPVLVLLRSWLNPKRETAMQPLVQEIRIHPIKSCRGIRVKEATLDTLGLVHDRRFMLVSKDKKRFQSQRALPAMALIHMGFVGDDLVATFGDLPPLYLATCPDLRRNAIDDDVVLDSSSSSDLVGRHAVVDPNDVTIVSIWNDKVRAMHVSKEHDEWFSKALGRSVELVRVLPPSEHHRPVGKLQDQFRKGAEAAFSDAYPLLLASSASLYDLNTRLPSPVTMDRFRPNIVASACLPFEEDAWRVVRVGTNTVLDVVEPCQRCTVPMVDPGTGKKDSTQEPTKTLLTYRGIGKAVFFGQNAVHRKTSGTIRVGDPITVLKRKEDPVSHLY